MDYLKKAQLINKCFGIYGYGHFDVTVEEFAHILEIIDDKNVEQKLKEFYDQLEKQRMGQGL